MLLNGLSEELEKEDKSVIKGIHEITRNEWIAFTWIDVTEMTDKTRKYKRGIFRPIEQSKDAAEQFDLFIRACNAVEAKRRGDFLVMKFGK